MTSISFRALRSLRHRFATAWLLAALLPAVVGCSGWLPWTASDKATKNAELYGPTANQRIKQLEAEAKQAKAEGSSQSVDFTRKLAEQLLAEHDARVRCEIVAIAGDFDTAAAVAICKGALQDPDERVRTRACEVWRKRGGAEAVQLLANRYRADRELDVRLRAIRMLGEMENEGAIPVLAEALEDPDPAVQYRAVAALKQVSGRDLGNDVNAWREWAANPGDVEPWSIAEAWRKLF
jgi:HEAT repeat protein